MVEVKKAELEAVAMETTNLTKQIRLKTPCQFPHIPSSALWFSILVPESPAFPRVIRGGGGA